MPSSGCQTCARSEEHTSELQSHSHLVCRLLLEKKIVLGAERDPPPAPALRARAAARRGRDQPLAPALAARPVALLGRGRDFLFFFNDTATTEIYTLTLHDALPI